VRLRLVAWSPDRGEVRSKVAGASYAAVRRQLGCPAFLTAPDPKGICTRSFGYGCRVPDRDAPGQGFDAWGSEGVRIMLDHPWWTAHMPAEGVIAEVAGSAQSKLTYYLSIDGSPPLTIALSAWAVALWAFVAVGAVAGFRSEHRGFWVFAVVRSPVPPSTLSRPAVRDSP
jgi:hypothetical protein